MSAATTWVQAVELSWRRSARFFENRFAALSLLEDRGLVRSFQVGDEDIGVRLGDSDHELEFTVGGLRGDVLAPDGDRDRIIEAAAIVVDALNVQDITRTLVRLRVLLPIREDYEKIRASAGVALFGHALLNKSIIDWALLVDSQSGVQNAWAHYEFGIVSKGEIPVRLAGLAGQPLGATPLDHQWDERRFPEVALFLHGMWDKTARQPVDEIAGSLRDYWDGVLEEADELVDQLARSLHLPVEEEEMLQ